MKGFNLKRLIPSLAVPTMIAAAAFAPLPGFPSAAHAAANLTTPTLQIVSPARLELATTGGSTNGIGLTFNYNCATGGAGTPNLNVTSTTQSAAQSGSGQSDSADSGTSGGPLPIICDGTTRQATTTLYGAGFFNTGLVTVAATMTDGSGVATTITPTIIRILA